MGADLICELPQEVTVEQVAELMEEAAGGEVDVDQHEDVPGLAGHMVTLTAEKIGRTTYHYPNEDTPEAVTILGRSFPHRLAFSRRLVERFGGRLVFHDGGWDGTFDLVLTEPAEAQRSGPLTEAEVTWAQERAAYDGT